MGTNSQEHLSPLEFTRLKPGVYCGDCAYSSQLLVEAFSNSFDELFRLIRKGDRKTGQINVTITGSKVEIEDDGDGFNINSKMGDGKTELECAFSELNTSGKYRADGTYEGVSLGNFGIGAKLPNFLSHKANVMSVRDGVYEHIWFEEGVFKKREVGKTKSHNGTQYIWEPSEEFFQDTRVDVKKIRKYLRTEACLCPGITINFTVDGVTETYLSKKGLVELVDEELGDTEIINNRLVINAREDKMQLDLVMSYTSNYSSTIVPYVNTGVTDTGTHITQVKSTLTREMNKFFKAKKWLKESDTNLSGDDISEGLYIIFNYIVPGVKYDAQVKSRVTEIDTKFLTSTFAEAINNWLVKNEKDVKAIVDKALVARKAREAAKKAKEAVRNKQEKKKKALKFDSKLADTSLKDRSQCELYVTEGDSASGTLKTTRFDNQAVIPVRGKVLNCQKATMTQILKNAEIVTMMDAFFGHDGWSVNAAGTGLTYDITKLRYGKIIIASDADVDGAHIKNLFYTFIWNICPELIKTGHIYALIAPLYRIIEKNGKSSTYLKDDAALLDYREKHKGEKYDVKRMKGLGEMDDDETKECLINPATRTIREVKVEDVTLANRLFEQLMGDSVLPRKQFLKQYGKEAIYNAE